MTLFLDMLLFVITFASVCVVIGLIYNLIVERKYK